MKHHTLLVHSQTRRLNDIWDLGLREAVDGTSLQWREQPSVAGHFAFPIMNSDCCPLWSIDERLKETNKNKEKEKKKKKERKEKTLTTHAYSFHFLGQFLSLLLPFPPPSPSLQQHSSRPWALALFLAASFSSLAAASSRRLASSSYSEKTH